MAIYMPGFFGESLFDEFFSDLERPRRSERQPQRGPGRPMPPAQPMRTDAWETQNSYELYMELPGVSKEDITIELKDGCLTISASTGEEDTGTGVFIRRERFAGSCSRTFYVGEEVTEREIHARFENGVLSLSIPKKDGRPAVETKKHIAIED